MVNKTYANIKVNFHCSEEELKSTHLIYLLKFPNGKYYVGQTNTKFGLISRIQSHCYESCRNSKKRNVYKDNIINKYKTFDVFILKKCTLNDVDFFEIFYINILKRKLINLENGGCENKVISEETRNKIKNKIREYNLKNPKQIKINVYDLEGNFIRYHNSIQELKEYYNTNKITINNALYKDNRIFLKKYQIFREGTEKIINYKKRVKHSSNYSKRKANNPNEIAFKYDSNTGEFIEEIKIGEMNSNERYKIKSAINNNSLCKGFAWSFNKSDSIIPPQKQYEKISEKLSKPILQLNDDLKIIKKWKNVREAGNFYNISPELIRQVCIRWRRHSKGYVWCFEDEYEWYKSMWNEKLVRKR